MDADTFLAWALEQEGRLELIAGQVVEAAAERAGHNQVKFEVCRGLRDSVRNAGLPCKVYTNGMAIRVDDATVYETDASLRCGEPLDDNAILFFARGGGGPITNPWPPDARAAYKIFNLSLSRYKPR